ncbi:MAG: hypothetical protein H0X16_12110 [Chloroflexi bacterium]|nr:hypothetical protein [Chloroflexota bacterium]
MRLQLTGVTVVASVLLVACSAFSPAPTPAPTLEFRPFPAPSGSPTAEPPLASLETLPPPEVLEPDQHDENGCLVYAPDQPPDCGVPADPADVADGPELPAVMGFSGDYYTNRLSAQDVVILSEATVVSTEGEWAARGLVRNETSSDVGDVTVTAALRGRDGGLLAKAETVVPIDPLRPGEPGPFELSSSVNASRVANVEWSVASNESLGSPRQFLIEQYWSLPYGNREPRGFEVGTDPPYPFIVFGSVFSRAGMPAVRPVVTTAWLDSEGGVSWVDSTPVEMASGLIELAPDSFGDFLVSIEDASVGPGLEFGRHLMWVSEARKVPDGAGALRLDHGGGLTQPHTGPENEGRNDTKCPDEKECP